MKRIALSVALALAMLFTPSLVGSAHASGTYIGYWQGSLGYVYWGDTCDYGSTNYPSRSMNINFSGGPRAGGSTYIYDFYLVNGTTAELNFPNGVVVGANGTYKVVYPERLNAGSSKRFIVNFQVPSRTVVASFYPVVNTRGCDLTQAAIVW